jgi:hypothetical protein
VTHDGPTHFWPRPKPARAASLLEKFRLQSTLAVAVLLVLFSLLSLTSSQRKSPTVDEPLHLFSLAAQGKRDEAISHYEMALNILRAGPKPSSSPDSSQNQP